MITHIRLTNFRKFSQLDLKTDNKIVILVGPNAVGKTSVLEAIYLTGTSKSHRTNDQSLLIASGQEFGIVEISASKEYKVVIHKEGKTNFINEVNYSKLSDFIGNLEIIMVSPLDIELITGSKGSKRRFLDLEISLLDKSYLRAINAYKKLLKERNEVLKSYNDDKKVILDVLTVQLVDLINDLARKRIDFIKLLNEQLKKVTKRLNCEDLRLEYQASYEINQIKKSFDNRLAYDLLTKTTNIGLHRDDFKIFINNQLIQDYASEGQIRTAILAIKLALKEIYTLKGKKIILLLDDIFASIDQKRINYLLEYIKNEEQTFITTTSILNVPDELIRKAKIIKL